MSAIKYKKFEQKIEPLNLQIIGEIVVLANTLELLAVEVSKTDFYSSESYEPAEKGQDRAKVFKGLNHKLREFEKNSRLHKLIEWRKPVDEMQALLKVRDAIVHGELTAGADEIMEFVSHKDSFGVVATTKNLTQIRDSLLNKIDLLLKIIRAIEMHDEDSGDWAIRATKNKPWHSRKS